jgi:deoxyribonuclease V
VLSVQADEICAAEDAAGLESELAALEENDFLHSPASDRLYQASARGDLAGERCRDARKGSRHENGIEGRVLGKAFAPVSDEDLCIADPVAREMFARRVGEIGPALDAPDEVREMGEQGRLEAVARPDLEDPLGTGQCERLHHPRHERRLGRDLVVRDRQRHVEVGSLDELGRNEVRPRNGAEGLKNPLVTDPVAADRLDEVGLRRRRHDASMPGMAGWPASAEKLMEEQVALGREAPAPWRPAGEPRSVAGCFVCFARGASGPGARGDAGWAGAALISGGSVVATGFATGSAPSAYAGGLLALREGPLLEAAVRALAETPEVLLVNATGRDHPRRAGLAFHLGSLLGIPTIGVTHRPLLAEGTWPPDEAGEAAPLALEGELVGYWLRTRAGTRPLCVHAAWRTDPDTALAVIRAAGGRKRTPEPIREARRIARSARAGMFGRSRTGKTPPV